MPNGATRRDFFKSALATTVAGIAAPAQPATPSPAATQHVHTTTAGDPPESFTFPRTLTGRHLARVSCPLGGIATGGIGLGGRGNLQDWQIFNRPDYGNALEYAFPSIWVSSGTKNHFAAVLDDDSFLPTTCSRKGSVSRTFPAFPDFRRLHSKAPFPFPKSTLKTPSAL